MPFLALVALLLFTETHMVFADEALPEDFRSLAQFMSVPTGDAKTISLAAKPNPEDCEETKKANELKSTTYKFPMKKNEKEWKFSVITSVSGPAETFKKEFMESPSWALRSDVNAIMKTKYDSHEKRLSAITDMCKGRSEMDRIQMASYLGSQLANIYDYDRTKPSHPNYNAVVVPEDQWKALYNRSQGSPSVSGVCRDATSTIVQFMRACGFSKDQLSMQSYNTTGAGHQIVFVKDSNGKIYTINWSELYATSQKAAIAPDLNPSNLATGIDYYSFDGDGKLVSYQKTELGNIIKAVSGGTPSDPNYLPHLMKLEASYGLFTANLYKGQTHSGDNAEGAAVHYKYTDRSQIFALSMGTSYTKNQKTVQTSPGYESNIDQTILYFQTEVSARPVIEVKRTADTLITVNPTAVVSSEFYQTKSKVDTDPGNVYKNSEMVGQGDLGLEAAFSKGKFSSWAGASTNIIMGATGNTEAAGDGKTLALNTHSVRAGASWNGEKVISSIEAQSTTSYFGNNYSVSTSIIGKNNQTEGTVVYSVYDRGHGIRDDYVMVKGEKKFSIERVSKVSVGVAAQLPLNGNSEDSTYLATLKFGNK